MTLPSGVVTFLFTDVVGSSTKWDMAGDVMGRAIRRHDEIIEKAIASQSGEVVKKTGDGFMAVFANPTEAVSAAVESQRMLGAEAWDAAIADFAVRMGIHTGSGKVVNGDDYLGSTPNKAARIEAAGHGGPDPRLGGYQGAG